MMAKNCKSYDLKLNAQNSIIKERIALTRDELLPGNFRSYYQHEVILCTVGYVYGTIPFLHAANGWLRVRPYEYFIAHQSLQVYDLYLFIIFNRTAYSSQPYELT